MCSVWTSPPIGLHHTHRQANTWMIHQYPNNFRTFKSKWKTCMMAPWMIIHKFTGLVSHLNKFRQPRPTVQRLLFNNLPAPKCPGFPSPFLSLGLDLSIWTAICRYLPPCNLDLCRNLLARWHRSHVESRKLLPGWGRL